MLSFDNKFMLTSLLIKLKVHICTKFCGVCIAGYC